MREYALAAVLAALLLPQASHAEVRSGPFPQTALSRGGELIWYTGDLHITGHRWREMDELCSQVPVRLTSRFRAPTEAEVRTLFVYVPQRNAVATWTQIHFANPQALTPAIAPFLNVGPNGIHPQLNIVLRNLYTYAGQPTTLSQVRPGPLYVITWFNRWTQPWLTLERSNRANPGDYQFGNSDRLLCVAQIPVSH